MFFDVVSPDSGEGATGDSARKQLQTESSGKFETPTWLGAPTAAFSEEPATDASPDYQQAFAGYK
jgi:hypothetical protein